MIDDIDRHILDELQHDSRISNVEIARRLKMAPSAILQRIRKLKKCGIIQEFTVRIKPDMIDKGLLAFVAIQTNERRSSRDVGKMIARFPEVLEVHVTAGEDSYLVKLRTKNTLTLYELLREMFSGNEAIASTKTIIVLHTVKSTSRLPIRNRAPLKSKR